MNYRSPLALLGLPLVHICTARIEDGRFKRGIARGWIAIGDVSFGVLLSIGGAAVGGIAIGGAAAGAFALSGVAIAVLALGGFALGYCAVGGAAFAWKAALGGLAIAHEFAIGGVAIAQHVNDEIARRFFEQDALLVIARNAVEYSRWLLILSAIPLVIALYRRRRNDAGPRRS
jgi:hypothetical protein